MTAHQELSEVIVRHTNLVQERGGFLPAQFHDDIDVAGCALDEQLEQMYRQYAAASRAVSRAKIELEMLAARDDIQAHILAQARRQRAAAETRCARLMTVIDALEVRLDHTEID